MTKQETRTTEQLIAEIARLEDRADFLETECQKENERRIEALNKIARAEGVATDATERARYAQGQLDDLKIKLAYAEGFLAARVGETYQPTSVSSPMDDLRPYLPSEIAKGLHRR